MDALQYVDDDVHSDVYVACMFYYTHHKEMIVPQYVPSGAVPQDPAHYMFHSRFPVTKKNDVISLL